MSQERGGGYRFPEDGFILPAGSWLMDQITDHPKRSFTIYAIGMGLMLLAAKCQTDRREAECLPETSCHRKMWEETKPGVPYPTPRPAYPPGFGINL